jgi:FkbM family methyltransferase
LAKRAALADLLLNTSQGIKTLRFSPDNLQYHSVYLPQHLPIYEPEVSAILTLLAPSTSCFWDVGANWGHHSLFLLAQDTFQGRVEAFEPNAKIAAELQQHFVATENDHRARCHPFGLFSRRAKANLEFPDGIHSGFARIRMKFRNLPANAELQEGDEAHLPAPDLIKIDAEGSEVEILSGCERILTEHHPAVIVELWPSDATQTTRIVQFLKRLHYTVYHPTFTQLTVGAEGPQHFSFFRYATGVLDLRDVGQSLALEKINAVALPPRHWLRPDHSLSAG